MKNFYLSILNALKHSTNLTNLRKKLNISKQQLNYYLRRLVKKGLIKKKARGWYEIEKRSKNSTKYGINLSKDIIRGHGYIWSIKFNKIPEKWDKRIQILEKRGIHFKLVGALRTTPRIKILGRKIWLCENHLRVYDKAKESYYGENAKESRYLAFQEIKLIVNALNRKLGVFLKPSQITFQREHYSLIKNDLAIEENRKGNIIRIKDQEGEWLLIDDSLEEGGELENIGKKAFPVNIQMQKWWNQHKDTQFEVTPRFILKALDGVITNQVMDAQNIIKHQKVLDDMLKTMKEIRKALVVTKK